MKIILRTKKNNNEKRNCIIFAFMFEKASRYLKVQNITFSFHKTHWLCMDLTIEVYRVALANWPFRSGSGGKSAGSDLVPVFGISRHEYHLKIWHLNIFSPYLLLNFFWNISYKGPKFLKRILDNILRAYLFPQKHPKVALFCIKIGI